MKFSISEREHGEDHINPDEQGESSVGHGDVDGGCDHTYDEDQYR